MNALTLELNKGLDLEINKENSNIINQVTNAFSKAVDNSVDKIDISDEYKKIVKSETRKEEFKSAGQQAVEAALRIGANAIGLKTSTFNSAKQILDALKAGDLKKGLSGALNIGIDMIKGVPSEAKKLIKSSKDLILGESLESELKKVMKKQKNTIDRIDKKCDKFDEAFEKKDLKEMEKQIKSIKVDLDKIMLIEKTINRARSNINKYELLKNKGDSSLTSLENEVCEKI